MSTNKQVKPSIVVEVFNEADSALVKRHSSQRR
jgi:hypothetical protein